MSVLSLRPGSGVPVSASAAAALSIPSGVTVVSAPPGLGAAEVVESWLRQSGTSALVADSEDVVEHLSALDGVAEPGVLVVLLTAGADPSSLADLALPVGWRIIGIDESGHAPRGGSGWTTVTARELLLSAEEVSEIAIASSGGDLDADRATELMELTHGWPSLVALAGAQPPRSGADAATEAARYGIREHIRSTTYPWFVAGQDAAVVDFLAIVDQFLPSEFESVALAAHRPALEGLFRDGLWDAVEDQGRTALRLLPPLGHLLRDGMRSGDSERYRAALRTVALARFESGAVDAGLAPAYELRDWQLCQRVLDRWWFTISFYRDQSLTHEVVMSMPAEHLRRSPICSTLAELYGVLEAGLAPHVPASEESMARLAGDPTVRPFIEHCALAVIARRWNGRIAEAHELALSASEVIDRTTFAHVEDKTKAGSGSAVADFKTFWYLQAGLACAVADDMGGSLRMYRQGWREHLWDSSGFAARDLAGKLAMHYAVTGERATAARWLATSSTLAGGSRYASTFYARERAIVERILILDEADADALKDSGAWPDVSDNKSELWPFALWAEVRTAMHRGALVRALKLIEDAPLHYRLTASSSGVHATMLRMLRADVEVAQGRGNHAERAVRDGVSSAYFGNVSAARFALLTGDPETARAEAGRSASDPRSSSRTLIEAGLIRAAAELESGDDAAAEASARRALAILKSASLPAAVLCLPNNAIGALSSLSRELGMLRQIRQRVDLPDLYPERVDLVRLTDRESVLLEQLAAGRTVDEIASALFVSRNTVKAQRRSLYAKLGVGSRPAALLRAQELGLIEP